jgi:SOS-response transcriptional repressor LexA
MQRQEFIGHRIRKAREELGLSLEELGRLYGNSPANLSRIENGSYRIGIPDLERLARILGKPFEWFMADQVKLPQRPPEAALSELQTSIKAFIPVVDEISAGGGIVPVDYVAVTRARPAPESLVALRVKGLCLEPEIKDGDTVIVDRAREPVNGNLVVVVLDGTASVKRYKEDREGNRWLENGYGTYQLDEVYLVGVVVNLDRPMV